jgi:hypothetical protein
MNDHDAIDAIRGELDRYFRGEFPEVTTIARISQIIGENVIDHEEAK